DTGVEVSRSAIQSEKISQTCVRRRRARPRLPTSARQYPSRTRVEPRRTQNRQQHSNIACFAGISRKALESPHLFPEPIPNGGSATSLVTPVAAPATRGPCTLNSSRGRVGRMGLLHR